MSSSGFHERTWEVLERGLEPRCFELRKRFLLEQTGSGDRVLDVGCGEGQFAAALLAAGCTVTAIDVAQEPLRRCADQVPKIDARLIRTAMPWPVEDGVCDLLWAGEVLQHVADTAGWLSEARRVLRPQGRLALSVPNRSRRSMLISSLSRRRFSELFDPLGDELHHYSSSSLSGLLREFGFAQVEVGRAGPRGSLLLAAAERGRW